MADLKKLDEIVDQLGVESEKLKDFHEIYAEIKQLKVDLESNINSFSSSSEKLDEVSNSLQDKTQGLTDKLTEIQSAIMQRVDLIEESNKKFQRDFDSEITSKLTKHKSDIEVTIRAGGDQTAKAIESTLNTTFLKELNDLKSKANNLTDKADDLKKKTVFLIGFGFVIVALNVFLIQSLIN